MSFPYLWSMEEKCYFRFSLLFRDENDFLYLAIWKNLCFLPSVYKLLLVFFAHRFHSDWCSPSNCEEIHDRVKNVLKSHQAHPRHLYVSFQNFSLEEFLLIGQENHLRYLKLAIFSHWEENRILYLKGVSVLL